MFCDKKIHKKLHCAQPNKLQMLGSSVRVEHPLEKIKLLLSYLLDEVGAWCIGVASYGGPSVRLSFLALPTAQLMLSIQSVVTVISTSLSSCLKRVSSDTLH